MQSFVVAASSSSSKLSEKKSHLGAPEGQTRDSVWTHFSTPLRPPKLPSSGLIKAGSISRPRRSLSESTTEKECLETGAVKIIIDRPDTSSNSEKDFKGGLPTIEVPIPHYRLGEPRFSARGTAFLHSSVYTRSSMTEELGSSLYGGEYDRLFPRPPALDSSQTISRRHSHASPQPYTAQGNPPYRRVPSTVTVHRVLYQPKGPIVPQIYDALATNPDDPSIVKYSPGTGEIVAASPARIIAQITSETFLDYELLSDFFLTVRAYLSTQDLLSYLVARFEWAINRFDDNGRVIRVRAFAALRHWILNYFAYDFVMDRNLRVTFCDRLNALTRIVRARATYGASDMKLIYDLKKCWNGRCILYWDNADATSESQKDSDIKPGGIVGSRDSQLSHPSQLLQGVATTDFAQAATSSVEVVSGSGQAIYYSTVPPTGERQMYGHIRQNSAATTRSLPTSPGSEQSVPVLSCSFATKGFKKASPYSNRAIGIHPVPTTPEGRRVCPAAPSAQSNEKALRPATAHRRSGSFSDAARDKREPLSSDRNAGSEEDIQLAQPFAGSLIRGVISSPGDPFVNVFAPTTPAVELPEMNLSSQTLGSGIHGSRKLSAQANPGVKHLFGNIRRALSSKNSNSNQNSSFSGSGSFGGSAISGNSFPVGKNPAIPMIVMYDAASVAQSGSLQPNARVDILAAEIAEAFNQAMIAHPDEHVQRLSSIGLAYGNELEQPSPDERPSHNSSPTPNASLAPPEMRRMDSGVTNGSQSIVIVDDTGLNVPDMPPMPMVLPGGVELHGAVTLNYETIPPHPMVPVGHQLPADMNQVDVDQVIADAGLASDLRPIHDPPKPEHQASASTLRQAVSPEKSGPTRPSLGYRGQSFKSTKSGSVSLRRYASFQSTFTKHSPGHSLDMKNNGAPIIGSSSSASNRPPVHVLRRRPGGDLRANHNVHDLEEIIRPRSTGSITTYSDSMRGSELFTAERMTRTVTTRLSSQATEPTQTLMPDHTATEAKRTTSYVRTHSSQPALRRPSFEAAVAQFAAIPDDEEGGLEATLLKLEGRYQKSPIQSPVPFAVSQTESPHATPLAHYGEGPETADQSDRLQHLETDSVVTLSSLPRSPEPQEATHLYHTATSDIQRSLPLDGTRPMIASTVYAESEESYNSTPLLERGADPRRGSLALPGPHMKSYNNSQLSPSDTGFETLSMRRLKHGSSAPTATTDSFLLDEDDDFLSDLSSELSQDFLDHDHAAEQWPTPQAQKENTVLVGDHPPSPPMTMENALSISSRANQTQEQRKPPTPDPSPVSQHVEPHIPYPSIGKQQVARMPSALLSKSRHMPFILGYDSELLAQQFTIIEKDALSEIDWRDLVDMKWQNTAPSVTNWVEYLRTQDPQGIDLVTARFNLMVKWALSEIVLTQNVDERALSITKYIHIAQKSRKVHNYATLMQLTIALTSTDCTRLTKTWELVPLAEKKILHELEDLVTPRRNFQNLRQEMEKANAEDGVIPFVGKFYFRLNFQAYGLTCVSALYIHDLTFNSQKPEQIANPVDDEPLINFERYRTTALIVKNLLRMIDASTKYTFQPVEGIIERCLWMAALPDETIRAKSKELE